MYVGGAPRSRPTPGLLLRGPCRMGDTEEEGVCVHLSLPLLPSTRKGRLCRGDPLRVPFAKRRRCTRLRVNENRPPRPQAHGTRTRVSPAGHGSGRGPGRGSAERGDCAPPRHRAPAPAAPQQARAPECCGAEEGRGGICKALEQMAL